MTDLHPAPEPFVLDVTGTDIADEAITLREQGPLVLVVLPGGIRAWAITDPRMLETVFTHPLISKDAYQHWPTFIAGDVPPDWPLITWVSVRNMFTAYGLDHRRLRNLVGPAFSIRRVEALRPQVEQIVTDLLDQLAARPAGTVVDLREEYAAQVPLRVITTLMGVPPDLQAGLRFCVEEILSTSPRRDPQVTFTEMVSILSTLVARRRAEPGNDMTSLLISHRDDDNDRLTEEELVHTLLLVITAGYETTVNLLDQAIVQLLTRPELLRQLRARVFTWGELIEETLRWAPPVANLPLRFAVTDLTLGGQQMTKGDAILACLAATNRDPHRHPNPDAFDPTRPSKKHQSFGYGHHHCLGAPLARMEAAIALPALFARFPDLTLAQPREQLQTLDSFISHGHQHLPTRLTRSADTTAEASGR